jgi:hypothetical protein
MSSTFEELISHLSEGYYEGYYSAHRAARINNIRDKAIIIFIGDEGEFKCQQHNKFGFNFTKVRKAWYLEGDGSWLVVEDDEIKRIVQTALGAGSNHSYWNEKNRPGFIPTHPCAGYPRKKVVPQVKLTHEEVVQGEQAIVALKLWIDS